MRYLGTPTQTVAAIVPSPLKALIDRYAGRHAALPSLDVLASSASPEQSLEDRLNWLVDVVQWIRRPGHDTETPPVNMSCQSGRLRRLLDMLERNPAWQLAVAKTLRSIFRETRAVALFSETGLPRQFGIYGRRCRNGCRANSCRRRRVRPGDWGTLLPAAVPHRQRRPWIEQLDEATRALEQFRALLAHGVAPEEKGWNVLGEELEDALAYLAAQICVTGCSGAIRQRMKNQSLRELAFCN